MESSQKTLEFGKITFKLLRTNQLLVLIYLFRVKQQYSIVANWWPFCVGIYFYQHPVDFLKRFNGNILFHQNKNEYLFPLNFGKAFSIFLFVTFY